MIFLSVAYIMYSNRNIIKRPLNNNRLYTTNGTSGRKKKSQNRFPRNGRARAEIFLRRCSGLSVHRYATTTYDGMHVINS